MNSMTERTERMESKTKGLRPFADLATVSLRPPQKLQPTRAGADIYEGRSVLPQRRVYAYAELVKSAKERTGYDINTRLEDLETGGHQEDRSYVMGVSPREAKLSILKRLRILADRLGLDGISFGFGEDGVLR